jgi:hypothetical protein
MLGWPFGGASIALSPRHRFGPLQGHIAGEQVWPQPAAGQADLLHGSGRRE